MVKQKIGVYVGVKLKRRSHKSGVPLWRWTLVKTMENVPTVSEIKEIIIAQGGLMGYAMRLFPRPWKKVSPTVKVTE